MRNEYQKREFDFKTHGVVSEAYNWYLDFILKYLEDPDVEDFQINREGEAKLIKKGGKIEIVKDSNFTIKRIKYVTIIIANMNKKEIDIASPSLSIILPINSIRYTCKMDKNIRSGIELSIRVPSFELFKPSNFGLNDAEFKFLKKHISIEGKNTFFIGSTGSGKTSFANLLISNIPYNENIKVVGDLHDFMFKKEHKISEYYAKTKEEYQDCIDTVVRTNPTRILISELTTMNVTPIFRLINTGHTGFYLTLHANNNINSVIDAFYQNLKSTDEFSDKNCIKEQIEQYVDFLIFLKKDNKGIRSINKIIILNPDLLEKAKKYKLFGYFNEKLEKKTYKKVNITLLKKLKINEKLSIREIQKKTGHSKKTITKYLKGIESADKKTKLLPAKKTYKKVNISVLFDLKFKEKLSIREIQKKTGHSKRTIEKYIKLLTEARAAKISL